MKESKQNPILIGGVMLIVGVAGGFFGGVQYQKTKTPTFGNFRMMGDRGGNFMQRGGSGAAGSRMAGLNRVMGEVLTVDETTITVKLPDGGSKLILLSDNTKFTKMDEGTKAEVAVGKNISVFGTTNSDGSVTATDVSLGIPIRAMPPSGE